MVRSGDVLKNEMCHVRVQIINSGINLIFFQKANALACSIGLISHCGRSLSQFFIIKSKLNTNFDIRISDMRRIGFID